MKREAWDHPKIKLVARDLRESMCNARGIVGSLWLFTGITYPQGDLRVTAEELAVAIDFMGDPDALLASLIKRKLIDVLEDGTWYVHDWHVHCDDATHMKLARHGLRFANGEIPTLRRLSKAERVKALEKYGLCAQDDLFVRTDEESERIAAHNGALPEPEPEPEPEPNKRLKTRESEIRKGGVGEKPRSPAPSGIPPSLDEVVAYFRELEVAAPEQEAQSFIAHYAAGGWTLRGGQPMVEWQPKAEGWRDKIAKFGPSKPASGGSKTPARSNGKPQEGVDFWWNANHDPVRRCQIVDGQKVDLPFDEEGWRSSRGDA